MHPIQKAIIDYHASQCGFCTPGIEMSLLALYKGTPRSTKEGVEEALVGNLCRCTGYRSIKDAGLSLRGKLSLDSFHYKKILLTKNFIQIGPKTRLWIIEPWIRRKQYFMAFTPWRQGLGTWKNITKRDLVL